MRCSDRPCPPATALHGSGRENAARSVSAFTERCAEAELPADGRPAAAAGAGAAAGFSTRVNTQRLSKAVATGGVPWVGTSSRKSTEGEAVQVRAATGSSAIRLRVPARPAPPAATAGPGAPRTAACSAPAGHAPAAPAPPPAPAAPQCGPGPTAARPRAAPCTEGGGRQAGGTGWDMPLTTRQQQEMPSRHS